MCLWIIETILMKVVIVNQFLVSLVCCLSLSIVNGNSAYGNELNQPAGDMPQTDQSGSAPKTGKPPQNAILVCAGKATKSQCAFQGPRGDESGLCENTPDNKYFACNPSRVDNQQTQAKTNNPVKTYPSHLKQ